MKKIKTREEIENLYGPFEQLNSQQTRVYDAWFAAHQEYQHLFDAENPYALENGRVLAFRVSYYPVISATALDFAVEKAINNKTLTNADGSPAEKYVAPEPPLEPVDQRFLEEIGRMNLERDIAPLFAADPNSRFCRRYRIASVKYGYSLPRNVQPQQELEAETDYSDLTRESYFRFAPHIIQRLHASNGSFRAAMKRLIADGHI